MPKGGFWDDTFEKLAELGKSTAGKTVKSMGSIVSPTKMFESVTGKQSGDRGIEQLEKGKSKKQNHTPLDFKKLQDSYQNQDKAKTDALRNRLFQMVKNEEEKLLMQHKQEEKQKKQRELYEKEQKKRQEEARLKASQSAELPHGKERRSVFSKKKVAKREQAEVKPSSGKQ